ncbi:hypothetical protein [Mesorhizobium australicum]|uniref:hypothetical protein n=1 Tax=Mesorhizobium australicum TaxID=536018 RepID=UPI003338C78D
MVAELSGAAAAEELSTVPGRVRQRRLWSCTEKRALVDLASAAGSLVTEVAEAFRRSSVTALCLAQADAGGELEADRAMATFARIEVNDLPEVERPVADCPDRPAESSWPFRTARDCGSTGPSIRRRCVSYWRS